MKRGRRKNAKRESRADREEYAERMYIEDEFIECVRCGGHCEWEDCDYCGGDGHREYNDTPEVWGEDCPSEVNHLVLCPECGGNGGYHRCGNTFEFCIANPLPGKENERRTR